MLINVSFLLALHLRFPDFGNPFEYWQPWAFINLVFFPLTLGLGVYRGIFKSTLENQKQHLKKLSRLQRYLPSQTTMLLRIISPTVE